MMHGASSLVQYAADVTANSTVVRKRTIMRWNGSGADIAAGAVVAISSDTTKGLMNSIKLSNNATANEDGRACGGAVRLIPNGTWGEVQVEGRQDLVLVNGTIAEGDLLDAGTTAGRLDPAAGTLLPTVARALSTNTGAPATGTASVQWLNPQKL